jgi:hypothetical protein
MEAEKTEALEAEIDRIIERRAREHNDANRTEELWRKSSRVHNARRRRENGAAWYDHHMAMREVHSRLASEHEAKALALLGAGGSKANEPM